MTNSIKVGILSTLHGPFEALGKDGLRGVEMALAEVGSRINGVSIETNIKGTVAAPDLATYAALDLVDQWGAQVVLGPLSGNEGLAVRNLAADYPRVTFLNGSSGAQDLTYPQAPSNFFSFAVNGCQAIYGAATYAYHKLGYRKVVTIGEDYSFPYAQVGSFIVEFCRAGGTIVDRHWVPLGTDDYREIIASIPGDVDAIFVALGGTDSATFLTQYAESGRRMRLIGASIFVDDFVLNAQGDLARVVWGLISSSLYAASNPDPAWQAFAARYHEMFPDGLGAPTYFSFAYYMATRALVLALTELGGDISNPAALQATLARLQFDGPCGPVRLDPYRMAIGNTFVTRLAPDVSGRFHQELVEVYTEVDQFLKIGETEYSALGLFGRENPVITNISAK